MTKEEYAIFKEYKLCPDCGNQAMKGGVFCFTCLSSRSEYEKERRANGYIKPAYLDGRHKEQNRARYERLKAAGMCPYCGQRKTTEGYSTCTICRIKRTEYQRSRKLQFLHI